MPCPNGLPIDTSLPGDHQLWRDRVERAREFSRRHSERIALRALGDESGAVFGPDDVGEIVELTKEILDVE